MRSMLKTARTSFDDPRHHLVVAVEHVVVGFCSAVDYIQPDKPPELWINEVGVAPTPQPWRGDETPSCDIGSRT